MIKHTLLISLICCLFLFVGCSENSADNNDFTDGEDDELTHLIQCKVINLDCEVKLGAGNSVQCRGIASHGNRCGSMTRNACGYCNYHTDQAPPAGQCLNQTKNASGICDYHSEFHSEFVE